MRYTYGLVPRSVHGTQTLAKRKINEGKQATDTNEHKQDVRHPSDVERLIMWSLAISVWRKQSDRAFSFIQRFVYFWLSESRDWHWMSNSRANRRHFSAHFLLWDGPRSPILTMVVKKGGAGACTQLQIDFSVQNLFYAKCQWISIKHLLLASISTAYSSFGAKGWI